MGQTLSGMQYKRKNNFYIFILYFKNRLLQKIRIKLKMAHIQSVVVVCKDGE